MGIGDFIHKLVGGAQRIVSKGDQIAQMIHKGLGMYREGRQVYDRIRGIYDEVRARKRDDAPRNEIERSVKRARTA